MMDLEEAEYISVYSADEGIEMEESSDSHENEERRSNQGDEAIEEDETDEESQLFDITITASHSYMGPELTSIGGRVVLEAGWRGRVPVKRHDGVVFPGETIPMLVTDSHDAQVVHEILAADKLFGLLMPDETGRMVCGYGVVCEVFEATTAGAPLQALKFKARALHRFRLTDLPKNPLHVTLYVSYFSRLQYEQIVVLPELQPTHPLRHIRLAALDSKRRPNAHPSQQDATVRRLDAALTPWPRFVYEMFDVARMRDTIQRYFNTVRQPGQLERLLPVEPVALSFWVACNLAASPRDRLALLLVDNALLRLHMECQIIAKKSILCCVTCGTEIARRDNIIAMSTDGAHSHYTNPGGFVHDVLTVSTVRHTRAAGAPSAEYSWFPGYLWAVAVCACCDQHVGWRFDAQHNKLRPKRFYALCQNFVVPRDAPPLPLDTPPL